MSTSSPRLRALYERAGARFLDLPVLHPADPFLETAGEDIRRRMFVTEGPAGRAAGAPAGFHHPRLPEHLRSGAGPQRYAYEGLVFRRHDSGAPERLETGYEDIGGADRIAADAEALALAVEAARAGHRGAAHGAHRRYRRSSSRCLLALGLPEPWRRRLRRSCGLPKMMAANLERMSAPRGGEDQRLDPELRAAADAHDRELVAAFVDARLSAHGHAEGAGRSPQEIADRFLDQRALAETHIGGEALDALRAFLALGSGLARGAAGARRFRAASWPRPWRRPGRLRRARRRDA